MVRVSAETNPDTTCHAAMLWTRKLPHDLRELDRAGQYNMYSEARHTVDRTCLEISRWLGLVDTEEGSGVLDLEEVQNGGRVVAQHLAHMTKKISKKVSLEPTAANTSTRHQTMWHNKC